VGAERFEARVSGSGGASELGEVVGDADERPFRLDLLDTAQQELSEASCLLDLTKDRLDDLLAQSVTAAPSRPLQLLPHGLRQPPGAVSFGVGRMLGAPGCEIGADAACRQGRQVRFAAVTGVGGGFFAWRPRLFLMALINGTS
jgi:hypothetical protein